MIKKICLLSCHNQYSSKRYFTQKFAEALTRAGIETHVLAWPHGPFPQELVKKIEEIKPDLTASFHQLPEQADGKYFWDTIKLPHWTILLDPAFYDIELIRSPYSLISCVDRGDCELLRSYQFKNTFFFPHAVERELVQPPQGEKPIDVIMLGTCYDPDNLYKYWKKTLPPEIVDVLEDAVTRVLTSERTTFFQALLQALTLQGIDPKEVEFDRLANYVDSYSRGVDRLNLIRCLKDVNVHVYGGKCWREEEPIADWSAYLGKQPNVTVHEPVNFADALQLLRQSKVCLNSMPFFKDGTHERVFASIACGAIPLTNSNGFLSEIFEDDEEILFYNSDDLSVINERVASLLHDPEHRLDMTIKGQKKVANQHTWDQRVALFLEAIKRFIK